METIVSDDPAGRLASDLVAYLSSRGGAHIAVSGGSTPRTLFKILVNEYRAAIPWGRITIWQVDERCVPPDDPQSNWRMLKEELSSRISDLISHRIEAEREGAAEDYEALMRRAVSNLNRFESHTTNPQPIPQLDLVLLGMGADGHTASLFPGTAALDEHKRLFVRNEVPQLNTHRITMTFPLINAARKRWFLVAGADKAAAFRRVQSGELPAANVNDATWYMDPPVLGG